MCTSCIIDESSLFDFLKEEDLVGKRNFDIVKFSFGDERDFVTQPFLMIKDSDKKNKIQNDFVFE